jgi:hypothetical protein
MTFEQCVKLKEIGFPRNIGEWFYDTDLPDPTAEEALAWVGKKLNNKIEGLFTENKYLLAYYVNSEINFKTDKKTLSDAVYALIVWAYENKLLNK